MLDLADDDMERRRRGTVAQVALTIFVGVPMTVGLITALGAYCALEYVRFRLFTKPEAQSFTSERKFTASLSKFAEVHGSEKSINVPGERDPVRSAAPDGERADQTARPVSDNG